MKPLLASSLEGFLFRFGSFKNAEIVSVELCSPTRIKLFLNVQDKNRGYNWIGVEFLFEDIVDARLVEDSKIHFLDMDDGISIIYEDQKFSFAVGAYSSIDGTKNASFFIVTQSLKYIELQANL